MLLLLDKSVPSDLLLILPGPIIVVVEVVFSDHIALKPPSRWLTMTPGVVVVVGSRIISFEV